MRVRLHRLFAATSVREGGAKFVPQQGVLLIAGERERKTEREREEERGREIKRKVARCILTYKPLN